MMEAKHRAPSSYSSLDAVGVTYGPRAQKYVELLWRTDPLAELMRERFGMGSAPRGPEKAQQGLGSGFIIDLKGTILTNNHVVAGADEVIVKLPDNRELAARVLGSDPPTDVAVVRLDKPPRDLQTVALGDSDTVRVGDYSHTSARYHVSGPPGVHQFLQWLGAMDELASNPTLFSGERRLGGALAALAAPFARLQRARYRVLVPVAVASVATMWLLGQVSYDSTYLHMIDANEREIERRKSYNRTCKEQIKQINREIDAERRKANAPVP